MRRAELKGWKMHLPAALLALLALLPAGTSYGESPHPSLELLHDAELAAIELDLGTACALWHEALAGPQEVRDVALYQLAAWVDYCPVNAETEAVTSLADAFPLPASQVWRAWHFANLSLRRAGHQEVADTYSPGRLEPQARGWLPVTAPILWTFAATSWPTESEPGEGNGTGGLAWTTSCFVVKQAGPVALRLTFPNPGRALLDGRELAIVGPDTSRTFPVEHLTAVYLEAGNHDLKVLQAVSAALGDVEVEFVPSAAASNAVCNTDSSSRWSLLPAPPIAAADELRSWLKLAHGEVTDADVRQWAAAALQSPGDYLRYRSAILDPALSIPRSDELWRELSASVLVNMEACLPRLDLADAHLAGGEREAARTLLEEADEACLATARGLLLQAEVALWMQWSALSDRYLQVAFDRYPENCQVRDRWSERQRTLGRPVEPVATACEVTRSGYELDALRRGKPVDIPPLDKFVLGWRDASGPLRERLLPTLAAHADDPDWGPVVDELIRTDAQLAWLLADYFLAAQQPEVAKRFAARATEHRSTWESLRTQAGRAFQWADLLPELALLDPLIDGYIDDGFAAGSTRVVVLDEAIARPGDNGWLTLAETTVLHVTSPDAAEAIGEVSVSSDEELVELAVRKADGRWFGPAGRGDSNFKETFSLAGLAPGDFIVRRTIRELALQGGGGSCHVLPIFYFTPREAPVYLSRYVLLDDSGIWDVAASPGVLLEQSEGRLVAEMRHLEPVPAEPRCPDAAAGPEWLQPRRPCASWDRLRNRVGDVLLGYCNGEMRGDGKESADAIYRRTLAEVEEDGSSLFDASQRDILERGRGNRTLALYCALVQAGLDAHVVATNSPAAPVVEWRRPSLSPFDVMLVYVGGKNSRWFDPYHALTEPGYVRPALRGRRGVILTPRYPRLFTQSDDSPALEGWKIELSAELEADGRLHGQLILEASGDAAVSIHRQVSKQGEEARKRLAESILYMMLPGIAVSDEDYRQEGAVVDLTIEFDGQVNVTDDGRLLLRLPPAPGQELVQLAQRTSALYFGGVLPTELFVDLQIDGNLSWSAPTVEEHSRDDFMELDFSVVASKRSLRVRKRVSASPRRVEPAQYEAFVESVMKLHRLKLLPIEVRHVGDR